MNQSTQIFPEASVHRSSLCLSRRGFSLIEVAIVLGIVGTMVAGLWLAASNILERNRQQQAVEAINLTVANARSYYTGKISLAGQTGMPNSDYPTITSTLLQAGVIPTYLQRAIACKVGPCADHPWGSYSSYGTIDTTGTFRVCPWIVGNAVPTKLCPTAAVAGSSTFFAIELAGLSYPSCIALVQAVTGPTGLSGLFDVNINGNNFVESSTAPFPLPIQPVTADNATTYCTVSANGAAVVRFIYRLTTPTP